MFIETHTHLTDEQFDLDRDLVLDRARAAGVESFVEIGEGESQWPKARALAEKHPDVYWTAGFHPYYAVKADDGLVQRLQEAVRHPRCVAVGEIGLDYHRDDSPRDVQQRVLADLVEAAVRVGKPIILHCRESGPNKTEAQRDMLAILKSHVFLPLPPAGEGRGEGGGKFFQRGRDRSFTRQLQADSPQASGAVPSGVAHCFQGSEETARALIERGFMIGVDAPITYPAAGALRALMATLPLESLVLETDSPYLPPQSHRGKRNEPTHIPAIAKALADIKHATTETIATVTSLNARRLFKLSPA